MADQNKFEEMLEKLVNEDRAGAEELFHEIVVEKSREIYENLRSVGNPGKWAWEHEAFNVKVSEIANYHNGKDKALIPLLTFTQNG